MQLSIVIPVFNESANILVLFDRIQQQFSDLTDYEVIFVDDGSTDSSRRVLDELTTQHPGFVCVERHDRNAGQSAALRTGVVVARADWVATLDGDGQNDPSDLRVLWRMVDQADDPLELYVGHRQKRQDSALRVLSSRIANAVRSWLLGDGVPDTGCGLKLFRRADFLALPYFDHMHRFLPALFQRNGGRVASIPVAHLPRLQGESSYGVHNRLWVGLADVLGVMWLKRRPPP